MAGDEQHESHPDRDPDRDPDPDPDPDPEDATVVTEVVTDRERDTRDEVRLVEYAHRLGPDPARVELDDAQVEQRVRSGAALLAAATAAWLADLAEFVVRGGWRDAGSPSTWLSWAVGVAPSTAREHVRVSLRLRDCPQVAARFAAGTLSYSKVRAITRVCDPSTEALLLAWADHAPAAALERIVADTRRVQRAGSADGDRDDLGVTRRWADDGTLLVTWRLAAADGIVLEQQLDRLVDLDQHAADTSADDRRHDTEAAPVPDDGGPDDGGSAARRPDVVAAASRVPRAVRESSLLLGAVTDAVRAGPDDTSGLDRHLVVLHVPADALTRSGPTLAVDGRGRPRLLPPVELDLATCATTLGAVADPSPPDDQATDGATDETTDDDGSCTCRDRCTCGTPESPAATTDPDGQLVPVQPPPARGLAHPRDLGRRRREPSMRLRRALWQRDLTCRFPGCGATRNLHAHHVVHWARGGRTDLANLVLLCGHHHRTVHRDAWRLLPDGPGRWQFLPADSDAPRRWAGPLDPAPALALLPEPDAEADADIDDQDQDGADHRGGAAPPVPATPVGSEPGPHVAGREGPPPTPRSAVARAIAANRSLADPRALLPAGWDGSPYDHDLAVGVLLRALDPAA